VFQACSFLALATSDLGLGGLHFAFVVLIAACDLLGHNPHVDCRFPFLPF